jgi:hypothetical protein
MKRAKMSIAVCRCSRAADPIIVQDAQKKGDTCAFLPGVGIPSASLWLQQVSVLSGTGARSVAIGLPSDMATQECSQL